MSKPFGFTTWRTKGAGPKARRLFAPLSVLSAEEEFGSGAHHLRGPHRLKGELGVHGLDALDTKRLGLDLFLNQISHRTHRTRQTESYVYVTPLVMDAHVVNQTKLHEIHPDLRVYHAHKLT